MKIIPEIGVLVPEILLPRAEIDRSKWAVIACDQFTSQAEYWNRVRKIVGDSPSTYHLVLPEVYLEEPDVEQRIHQIQKSMQDYLTKNYFETFLGLILVERTNGETTRRGLMLALDLENYNFSEGSESLIRATEGTIVDRLPPRIKIRSGAPLELPHILVLIDDPLRTIIEPLAERTAELTLLYDFELMLGSGHLRGYAVDHSELEKSTLNAIRKLADPELFSQKYAVPPDTPVLLFAMGDGNHSLATAKAIWEQMKPEVKADHPARFALVEVVNVHDAGLRFEPIHRVLFGVQQDPIWAAEQFFGTRLEIQGLVNPAEMVAAVEGAGTSPQTIGFVSSEGTGLFKISQPKFNLPVGSLQQFLDHFLAEGGAEKIDYVHGAQVTQDLGMQPGNFGFYLPTMSKEALFKTVILDGALPRKTFSMGEAHEKRFYYEARKIV